MSDGAATIDERILAAAASCIVVYGLDRVTLSEIARRAGVSRPTVYRRWPATQSILSALLTERVTGAWQAAPVRGEGREALVRRIVAVAQLLLDDDVFLEVMHSAPELAMVYFGERLGTSQRLLIDTVTRDLDIAQRHGSVRSGDPRGMAAMVLLITQSTVQSAPIVRSILDADRLLVELAHVLNGYLS